MKHFIVLLCVLLFAWLVVAQVEDDPNLDDSKNNNQLERCYRPSGTITDEIRNLYCEHWVPKLDTENKILPRYCNDNGVCGLKTGKTYDETKETDLNPTTQYCSDSFHPRAQTGNDNKCFAVANWNCVIPNGQQTHIRCAARSTRNAGGDQSCVPPTEAAATEEVVGLGEECGINNQAQTPLPKNCGFNLRCSGQRKCIEKSSVNQHCDSSADCRHGLLCSSNKCINTYSVDVGGHCPYGTTEGNPTCKTGYCGRDSRCTHTSTQRECIKDADCNLNYLSQGSNPVPVHEHTVCVISGKYEIGKKGWCSAFYQPAMADWTKCMYEQCNAPLGSQFYNDKCKDDYTYGVDPAHPCIKHYVRAQCARNCAKGYDHRLDSNLRYTFNCDPEKLTATAWGTSDCEIKQQFLNCDMITRYPASAPGRHASIAVLIAVITFVMMFI